MPAKGTFLHCEQPGLCWGLGCGCLSFLNALFSWKNDYELTFLLCSSYMPCACKAVTSFLKKIASDCLYLSSFCEQLNVYQMGAPGVERGCPMFFQDSNWELGCFFSSSLFYSLFFIFPNKCNICLGLSSSEMISP